MALHLTVAVKLTLNGPWVTFTGQVPVYAIKFADGSIWGPGGWQEKLIDNTAKF